MPNLPERKESPIMGSSGVGGGVGSNLISAKGGVYDASNYVDGLFSAYAFRGNSTAGHEIKTDIDMTKEGLVWIKKYTGSDNHLFQDTFSTSSFGSTTENNGASAWVTNNNNAITSFNNNGFTLGGGAWGSNASGEDIIAFSFRKRAKFFDLVEFTEGSSNQTIPHNLGCQPKMIVFACKTNGTNWWTWMDGITSTSQYLRLNTSDQVTNLGFDGWGTINLNSFEFKPSVWGVGAGAKWVAYLWAGDEN